MSKGIFAKSMGKVVPIIGGAISGGITYGTYRPLASRLRKYLIELPIADVEYYESEKTEESDIIDGDFEIIED